MSNIEIALIIDKNIKFRKVGKSFMRTIGKIKKFVNQTKHSLIIGNKFGLKMGTLDFLSDTVFRCRGSIGRKMDYLKHEEVKGILKRRYCACIESCEAEFKTWKYEEISSDAPIWILWWQGIEQAPTVVKDCIQSVREHSNHHEVYVLNKENYAQFVDISGEVIEKLNCGAISVTHFSDILRMTILYERGGIWIDSTVFLTDKVDRVLQRGSFATIRHEIGMNYHVCKGLWSTFFLVCTPKHPLIGGIKNILISYVMREDTFICYLLIDCIIAVLYENIVVAKQVIDSVPKYEGNIFELQERLSSMYIPEDYIEWKRITYISKLSYKQKQLEMVDGMETVYHHICQNAHL